MRRVYKAAAGGRCKDGVVVCVADTLFESRINLSAAAANGRRFVWRPLRNSTAHRALADTFPAHKQLAERRGGLSFAFAFEDVAKTPTDEIRGVRGLRGARRKRPH